MKKTLIFFVGLVSYLGVSAQDTVVSSRLDSSYFCNFWPDAEDYKFVIPTPCAGGDSSKFIYLAKRFYSPDTITVYGIAVAYMCVDGVTPWEETIYDTSWDNAYEYFSLYRDAVGVDSLVCISDSLKIHARNTPIAYFHNFEEEGPFRNIYPAFYEKFFDSAYQVHGRFYVARTHRSFTDQYYDSVSQIRYSQEKRCVYIPTIFFRDRKTGSVVYDTLVEKIHFEASDGPYIPDLMSPDTTEWHTGFSSEHYLMFPIIDTSRGVGYGPDTNDVALSEVSMANRFVVLTPNPAKERVSVTSSCGMSHLTVYSPNGEIVLDKDVSGNGITLDITGWVPGCYIVHIKTLLGTAVKKLVVL